MKTQLGNFRVFSALMLGLAFCTADLADGVENGKLTEADITRATAGLLDHSQFSQRPFDDILSRQFLDGYLDALDSAHLLFLQTDLDEFARFLPGLGKKTLVEGETETAHAIYRRYLQRLVQHANFTVSLLQNEKFEFLGHDSWQTDRRDATRPRDLAAAQALWRKELREDYLLEKLTGTPIVSIVPTLARRYTRLLQTMRLLNTDEVLEIYLDALAHVYDPHSDYFRPEESADFNIAMNLRLVGIGGTLKVKGGYCIINNLIPSGPAARSGLLKPGDRIVAVAQDVGEPVNVMGLPSVQVVELIRGVKGSTVRLTIIPAGAANFIRKTVSLVRDNINLADEHATAAIIDLPQTPGPPLRVGVVELPLFYGKSDGISGGASADIADFLKKLKRERVRGLILDLRRNAGGSLAEAIRVTGLFIPSGPVVQLLNLEDDLEVDASPETNAFYDGPLVVLTSRLSASASEIVAGALQDYRRALIVGDSSTFGKGTVQNIVPLKEFFHQRGLGAVNVTTGKFYRPSGASTQLKGVVPDIILPSETDVPDIGKSKLPNALPWDILPPTTYTRFDLLSPVAGLREKSHARVVSNPGFRLVRKELAMAQKSEQAKSLSLNEAERRRLKAQADDVQAEMRKVFLTGAARTFPTRYISLGEVESTGLSPAQLPTQPPTAVGKPAEINPANEIELNEAENILADYIHALSPRPYD